MSFFSLLSAVPIPAILLLLIVSGMIFFQLFIVGQNKELKAPEINLPKLEDIKLLLSKKISSAPSEPPPSPTTEPPPLPTPLPPFQGLNVQLKSPLPLKQLATIILLVFTFLAIFLTVYLIKKNQEQREQAAEQADDGGGTSPTSTTRCFCPGSCENGGCWKGSSGPNECPAKCCEPGGCPRKPCGNSPNGTAKCIPGKALSVEVCTDGTWVTANCAANYYCPIGGTRCVYYSIPPCICPHPCTPGKEYLCYMGTVDAGPNFSLLLHPWGAHAQGATSIAYLCDPDCCRGKCPATTQPTPTPTPTPTPRPTPRPTPTPTPTPTSSPTTTASCDLIEAYDSSWNKITNWQNVQVGQTVYFASGWTTNDPAGITKARFRIKSGAWQETTTKHNELFYIQYTIPQAGAYKVEAMVYNPTLGWR